MSDPIAGILLIDKPVGPTSMGVCARVRGALVGGGAPRRIKVGHGGTLDPLASGLMVVLVGAATRLCDRVMGGEKRYLATIDLLHTSPTDDLESEPVVTPIEHVPDRTEIEAILPRFTGPIMQAPPAHSAIKVGGKRAYALARAGRLDTLEPRPVVIHELRVIGFEWPRLVLDIRCGKGVYIRSLARDLGKALGVGGMLAGLRRSAVGSYSVEDATAMDELPRTLSSSDLLVTPEVKAILDRRHEAHPRRTTPDDPDTSGG